MLNSEGGYFGLRGMDRLSISSLTDRVSVHEVGPRDVDRGLLHALARGHVLHARGEAVPLVPTVAGVLGVVPRRVERVGQRDEAPRQEVVVTHLKGIQDILDKGSSLTKFRQSKQT